MIQPKPFLRNMKLRNQSYGVERRRNMSKIILEHGTPFPKGVSYKDIDLAFTEFVKNNLKISYDGTELPTVNLFSNQKIGEYAQTWNYLDDVGNLILNFKTITRENNPQKGKIYGDYFNIPGNRDYPMFLVPKLQENGQEAYDLYTMKQPMGVDFIYTVSIITNKFELLNQFNELVQYQFKALQCYISPNGHPMSLVLDTISDESEYNVDNRRFYSQSYKIILRGYIINQDDFKVTLLPSRQIIVTEGMTDNKKNKEKHVDYCVSPMPSDNCDYYYKGITVNCNFSDCLKKLSFVLDYNITLNTIELSNIYDFTICVNDEFIDFKTIESFKFLKNDKIDILIEKNDDFNISILKIIGYDEDTIIDKNYNPESTLDDITDLEIIDVNK